jgi:hypothetical protein
MAEARVLDWASTEECLRRPWNSHVGKLPTALMKNKAAFTAFEWG